MSIILEREGRIRVGWFDSCQHRLCGGAEMLESGTSLGPVSLVGRPCESHGASFMLDISYIIYENMCVLRIVVGDG